MTVLADNFRIASNIVQRDVKILFSDSFLVAIMFANFAIDLFVTAATFGRLVPPSSGIPDYFKFIAPGSNFVTCSVAAFQSGRDIWRERYIKDLTSYLLSLPASRRLWSVSRVAGGVARSLIATFPGTLTICYLYGILLDPRILGAFSIVGLFSLGVVGISMAVSAYASSIEVFVTVRSTVQLYFSFFSTLFFSPDVFPAFLRPIVLANPMTWAVEAFRQLSKPGVGLGPASVLVVPSLAFAALGTIVYLYHNQL